ncbi:arca-like protein [Phlyctema vagabunda]|uniref:Arca-like protein n=1 Tax=Phlyctema vagabunda TaxID=108571 RepID=A0ABR4PJK7_9HELO
MKHKSVQLNLEHCLVDRSFEPSSDFGWANRAVIHCADVLNCCFGELGVSIPHWTELNERSERWESLKPPSFIPIYYKKADREKGEAFPEIWYSHACHIIGIQHFMLAQILLAIFNPNIPRIGGSRNTALRSMEEEIKSRLRELCGIGMSNRWTPPGMFTASMGISLCGDRFTERIDQEALLDVLANTEKDHARPTAVLQQQMMKSWGWISDD